jgi:hypothetical protein
MKRWILLMKSGEVNTLKHNYLAFYQNIAADRNFPRAIRSASLSFHRPFPYPAAQQILWLSRFLQAPHKHFINL